MKFTKRCMILVAVLLLILQILPCSASANDVIAEVNKIMKNSDYMSVLIKAADVEKDPVTGVVTFKNEFMYADSGEVDTNTYVIDDATLLYGIDSGFPSLDDFVSGKAVWTDGYILKSQHWKYSGTKNQTIHLVTCGGFSKSLSIVSNYTFFNRLGEYGIMTKDISGNFAPYDTVSRSSMSKILASALCRSKVDAAADFYDVSLDHWANRYIGIAQSSHLISGFEDGSFRPDDDITNAQAIKMIVCMLGYEPMAKQMGGYPNGYINVAKNIGLLDGLEELNPDEPCTRKTVAQILDKALDTPLMMVTLLSANEGETEYGIFDGKNLELRTLLTFYWEVDAETEATTDE